LAKNKSKCIAVRRQFCHTVTGNSHAIWEGSRSVIYHPTEVRIPPLTPAESVTRFSDAGGIQG